jgi:anti-sigma-K factor RskA
MTRRSEARDPRSRLPDDPRYWQRLSERIMTDATPRLRARRAAWWSVMESSWRLLATTAAAAVVAGIILMQPRGGAPGGAVAANVYGLTPADSLAAPLVQGEAPPPMPSLLGLAGRRSEQ